MTQLRLVYHQLGLPPTLIIFFSLRLKIYEPSTSSATSSQATRPPETLEKAAALSFETVHDAEAKPSDLSDPAGVLLSSKDMIQLTPQTKESQEQSGQAKQTRTSPRKKVTSSQSKNDTQQTSSLKKVAEACAKEKSAEVSSNYKDLPSDFQPDHNLVSTDEVGINSKWLVR